MTSNMKRAKTCLTLLSREQEKKEGHFFLSLQKERLFEFHWSYFWSASFTFGISHPILCVAHANHWNLLETQPLLSWKQFFSVSYSNELFFWELNVFDQVLKSRQCFMVLLETILEWWLITVSIFNSFCYPFLLWILNMNFFIHFWVIFYEQVEISHKFKEWNYTFGYINYKALCYNSCLLLLLVVLGLNRLMVCNFWL